jgi:DNA-binding transcriptional MocR family regulator
LERRHELLEIAYKHDVIVLDDEAYRELWYDTPPPACLSALADGYGVITTGTFSKTVATGLRVGYVHAQPEILNLLGRMRFGMGQNQQGLRAFGEFLNAGDYEPHLEQVKNIYREKCDVLHKALKRNVSEFLDWQQPDGGFYLWASLKQEINATDLWRTAIEEGIAINPGTGFSQPGTAPANCVRIAYAWTPIEHFDEAARRLRLACERVVAGDIA